MSELRKKYMNQLLQVENKKEQHEVKQQATTNRVNPFPANALNRKYHETVVELGKYTTPGKAMEEAYSAVSQFRDTVLAYNEAGGTDATAAMTAARKKLSTQVAGMRVKHMMEGKTYQEMMALAREKGAVTSGDKVSELSKGGGLTEGTRMNILTGDTTSNDISKALKSWADFRNEQPENVDAYIDLYENANKYANQIKMQGIESLSPIHQKAWAKLTNEIQGWDGDASSEYLTNYGMQQANYIREAEKYQQGYDEETQMILDYARRNTLEGAQEWAESEPDNQEAKDNLWVMEREEEYARIPQAVDFAEKSQEEVKNIGLFSSEDDLKYAYINNQGDIRNTTNLRFDMSGGNNPYAIYEQLEPEEVLKYNYLHAQEDGKKRADEYLKYKEYELHERQNAEAAQLAYDLAGKDAASAALMSAVSTFGSMTRGINYADVLLQKLTNDGRPVNYERTAAPGIITDSIRQGVMDRTDWNVNILGHEIDAFDFLYGTAMSGVDSATAAAFGPAVGSFILGSSAAQSTLKDIHDRGGNDGQALIGGAASGLFEYLFEKISLGNLWKGTKNINAGDFAAGVKTVAREMGVNFSEEFLTSLANTTYDTVFMGDLSKINQQYEYYRSLGLTHEEARAKVAGETAAQLMEEGFAGAFMGAAFGTAEATGSAINTRKATNAAGQNVTQAGTRGTLKRIAESFGKDSAPGKAAAAYNAETATNKETGKIFREVINAMPGKNPKSMEMKMKMVDLIADDVSAKLQEKGETENVKAVATAVTKLWADMELDTQDYQALSASQYGLEVAEDLFELRQNNQQAQEAQKTEKEEDQNTPSDEQAAQAQEEKPAPESEIKKEKPKAVAMDDDGTITVEENGRQVELEDSALSDDEKTMIRETQDMRPETAAALQKEFLNTKDMSAHDFTMGFKRAVEAYKAGKEPTGIYAKMLSESSLEAARAAAEVETQTDRTETQQATRKAAEEMGLEALAPNVGNEAGVKLVSVTERMSSFVESQLKVLDKVAKQMGVQIRVYDTLKSPGGKKANATYEQGSNIINLSVNAEAQLLTKAVSHEGYHFIREWNQEGADKIRALVLGFLDGKDGYDMNARIREKIAEYERGGVTLDEDGAMEEIVADGLLDYIGNEANFSALLKEDKTLSMKIKEWISQAAQTIRDVIEKLTNKEAEALRDDLSYLEARDQMMAGVLKKAADNLKAAQAGLFGSAKSDVAVQEYQQEMESAQNAQQKQEALNGLVGTMLARTQKAWMEAHPQADLNKATEKMRSALLSYGQGKNTVADALEGAGFSALRAGTHTMRVMSYIGQQAALIEKEAAQEDSEKQYSFVGIDEESGKNIYRVDFGEGKNKTEKRKMLADLIVNTWSKAPISLTIDKDGKKEKITAAFDPDFDPTNERKTDVGKMVFGNRMGSPRERNITLGLSGDMYQIISDSEYITHANEIGKDDTTHEGVKQWHYFATDILIEGNEEEKLPFTVFIDIKEKENGNYVYTFYALNEEKSARLRSSNAVATDNYTGKNSNKPITAAYGNHDTTALRSKTEVNSNKTVAAASGESASSGASEFDDADSNSNIAENQDNVNGKVFSLSEESAPNVMDDAELYAQSQSDKDMEAALMLVKRLHDTATKGAGYLAREEEPAIQKGDWQKRIAEIKDRLLTETGSRYSGNKLLKRLDTLFSSMDEQDQEVGDLLMYARGIGRDLLNETPGMLEEMGAETKEALKILKNSRFYLTDDMKSEIRERYGSVKAYQQKNFGKMGIRAKAKSGQGGARMSLAELWPELSQIMPGTFAEDATEADMPMIVDTFLETAGNRTYSGTYGGNAEHFATDIGLQLILDYYDLPGALKRRGEMLEEYREKVTEIRQGYQQKYEDRMATEEERRVNRETKNKLLKEIGSDVKYLNTRIVSESDTRHVPDELRGAVLRFMGSFLNDTSVFDKKRLSELREAYGRIRETGANEDSYAAWAYDEDVMNMLTRMEKTIDGMRLSKLTMDELQDVHDIVGNLKKMVVEGNEITINGVKQKMDHEGTKLLDEMKRKKNVKNEKLQALLNRNITPVYFFKNIGGVFSKAFNDMRSGQGKYTEIMNSARNYLNEKLKEYNVNKWLWTGDNLIFTTARGEKLEMNKGLAMALYATWQRETKNKAQDANHLRMGGFVYPKDVKIQDKKVDVNRPHALAASDMEQIGRYLGSEGVGFVNDMVSYLSNDMAKLGNEVSMALYGYRKFTEGYYFPYSSSRDFLQTDVTKSVEGAEKTLKSWGAAKKLTEKANNPIQIGDFLDIWSKHVNQMATYSSFTLPMETMNRLYNFKTAVMDDETPRSVKGEMKRAYGESAEEYIRTLMRDIAGGVRTDERNGLVNKMISLHKKNSVVASASVAIQQPSSIIRAMALVNPKYFVGAPRNAFKSWNELTQYSGVARVKEMGRFDTGTGRSAQEWLMDSVQDEKAWQRLANTAEKVTGFAPEKMDQMTWGMIWEAVKREQQAQGVDIRTEEGLKKCAERFDYVADSTQVYDSVLAKSAMMRSRSAIDRMVTSFMSEPTVSFNLLADAIRHIGDQKYEGRVTVKRAAAAYTVSVLFNAMLKSLITAGREDDEEKTYVEKYMGELSDNFLSDWNPLNLIPMVRDVVSIFSGYDVERADMSIISDLQYSIEILLNEEKGLYKKTETGLGGIAALFGIPLKNILRDARTAFNIFAGSRPLAETDPAAIRYSMLEGLPEVDGIFDLYDDSKTAYYQRMANAAVEGNDPEYDNLERYMTTRKGTDEKAVNTGVTSAMKEMHMAGAVDDITAMQFLEDKAGKSEDDAFWTVDKWKGGSDYTKYKEFAEAVKTAKNLKTVIKKYTDNGTDAKTLAGKITEEFKDEYIRLYKTDKAEFANLQARLLTAYEALGYDRNKKKKDMEAWLKDE